MNRLQLHDTITITSTLTGSGRPEDMTVRAHVYTLSGENPAEPNRPYLMVSQLRAMVAPLPREVDPAYDRVVHHGTTYKIDGPPMGRYRRGKVHHWTINLERITG